jgi:hypothetical protein
MVLTAVRPDLNRESAGQQQDKGVTAGVAAIRHGEWPFLCLATQATRDQAAAEQDQRNPCEEPPRTFGSFLGGRCRRDFSHLQSGGEQIDDFAGLNRQRQRVFAGLGEGGRG